MKHTSPRKRTLASLHRSLHSLTTELLSVYEELELLHSLGVQIGRLADESHIAGVALREVKEILSADCGWVTLWEAGKPQIPKGCLIEIKFRAANQINRTVLEPCFSQGKTQILMHSLRKEFPLGVETVPAPFLASGLTIGESLLGYISLGRRESGHCFTSADQKLIVSVARQTAAVLENVRLQRSEWEKERMANELRLARRIQQSLLPKDFSFAEFVRATGISEPCQEIGGDYFDFFPLSPEQVILVIADVTGKGPSAALQASMIQGIVHGVSCQRTNPASLLSTLNQCLLRRALEGSNVSIFLATLDESGLLRYSNGGHNPPLWIRAGGEVEELSEGGLLLGFLESATYSESSIQLAPGDLLVLYTDGITDTEDAQGNHFGSARLLNWACRQSGRSPSEVKESLIGTLSQFCRGTRQPDDLTMLAAQYTGSTIL